MKTAAKRARNPRATRSAPSASPPVAGSARVPVAKTYKLYIDGKFPRSESGRYYPLQDSRERLIANVCLGSRKDFRSEEHTSELQSPI